MILKCTCEHKFQDSKHGSKLRVHNYAPRSKELGGSEGYRCTVCGALKPKGSAKSQ